MISGPSSGFRSHPSFGLAILTAAAALFAVLRWGEFPVGAGMDDAYYIELARSLAEGRGPVIHLNDALPGWRPGIFPLGLPLLLVPVAWLAPAAVQAFKAVPLLALAGLVPVCLMLARSGPEKRRLALTALVCLNPWITAYAVRVFSDLPFTVVSLAAVILFTGTADASRITRRRFTALVVATGAAVMIRSIGLALPVAMAACWCWQRRWRRAFVLVVGVAIVLLPHAVASGEAGAGLVTRSYLRQVFEGDGAAVSRIGLMTGNLAGYLKELAAVMLPVFGNPLDSLAVRWGVPGVPGPLQLAAGIVLVAMVVRGLFTAAGDRPTRSLFLAIYLSVYGVVLLNFAGYPSGVQARLLLPVLPLLFLLLLEAFESPTFRRFRWPLVVLMLSLSVGHNSFRAARPVVAANLASGEILKNPVPGSEWIRCHTGPEELVMTRWPLRQHIHFLRPVVGYGTVGPAELERRIERFGVDYIFLGSGPWDETASRLEALLAAQPVRFPTAYRDPDADILIFRVQPDP